MKGVTQYCAKPPSIIQIKTDDVIPLDRAHFSFTMTHSTGPILTDGTTSIRYRCRTYWLVGEIKQLRLKVDNVRHDLTTAKSTQDLTFELNRTVICRTEPS